MLKWDDIDKQSQEFLKNVYKSCSMLKEKKIAIYGIGAYTKYFLELFKDFHVIGLLDKEPSNIGNYFYGKKVLSIEDAVEAADAILIMSFTQTYWQIIYNRIADSVGECIPVYFPNGDIARKLIREENNNPYWSNTKEQLKELVNHYEVISFDIFDTLLMRKVLLPQDIWKVMQARNKKSPFFEGDFVTVREAAMRQAYLKSPNYNFDEVYDAFQELTDCTDELRDKVKQLELDYEKRFIVARNDIQEVLEYALSMKKTVYLLSDMYLSEKDIRKLLQENGIGGEYHVWISAERNESKADGTLWAAYTQELGGRKALHIGDNIATDIDNAKNHGIDAYHIYSSYELLLHSNLSELASHAITISDSVVLGMILAKYFNSPFVLSDTKGRVVIDDFEDLGYFAFGSMYHDFMEYLYDKVDKDNIDSLVFFSRDAYVPFIGYQQNRQAVQTVYLRTSRMFNMILNLHGKADIFEIGKIPFNGTWKDYLLYRFGIACHEEDPNKTEIIDAVINFNQICVWLERYEKEILRNAEHQRNCYKKYIEGLRLKKNIAVVDIGYTGSSQYYLEQFTQKKYKGYYLHIQASESNQYYQINDMRAVYEDKEKICSNITQNTQIVEAVFVAPDGMFLGFDSCGEMCYDELNYNQKNYHMKQLIHKGMFAFAEECEMLFGEDVLYVEKCSHQLADTIVGSIFLQSENLSDEIRNSFYIDNAYIGMPERKILA